MPLPLPRSSRLLALALTFAVVAAAPVRARAGAGAAVAQERRGARQDEPERADSVPPAEEEASPRLEELEPGGMWSLLYGFGTSQLINRSADFSVVSAGVRWSHVGGHRGSGALRGHPSVAFELLPVVAFFPEGDEPGDDGYGPGAHVLYEHRFAPRGRWLPVWRVGGGVVYSNRRVPRGEERLNFSLFTGFALDVLVTAGGALSFEYRFHHVSNADRGFRNPGVNAHTLLLGYVFYR